MNLERGSDLLEFLVRFQVVAQFKPTHCGSQMVQVGRFNRFHRCEERLQAACLPIVARQSRGLSGNGKMIHRELITTSPVICLPALCMIA
jgi:hypothetical protein